METQIGRKPPLPLSQPSIFYYRENILQHMCWRGLLPARRHPHALVYQPLLEGSYDPLLLFTSLSWKEATTPCSHLPASPRRELRPHALVYQPHLEGSYNPLIEGYNPQHQHGPRFINFHTGSKSFLYSTTCRPLFIIFPDWTHSIRLSSIIHQN